MTSVANPHTHMSALRTRASSVPFSRGDSLSFFKHFATSTSERAEPFVLLYGGLAGCSVGSDVYCRFFKPSSTYVVPKNDTCSSRHLLGAHVRPGRKSWFHMPRTVRPAYLRILVQRSRLRSSAYPRLGDFAACAGRRRRDDRFFFLHKLTPSLAHRRKVLDAFFEAVTSTTRCHPSPRPRRQFMSRLAHCCGPGTYIHTVCVCVRGGIFCGKLVSRVRGLELSTEKHASSPL